MIEVIMRDTGIGIKLEDQNIVRLDIPVIKREIIQQN